MALTDRQQRAILGFVEVLFTPAAVERARRVENTHTADGKLRAEELTGELPGYVLPMIELGQLPAPDGTDFDTLEDYINNLTGAFLPTSNPTFTGTLTGPTLAITGDATIGDDLLVTDVLSVSGDSNLGNSAGDVALVWGHLRHKSSAPSIAVGAALGTGGSVDATIAGTDQRMTITLTAGTTSLTTGTAATITFNTARVGNVVHAWSPNNASARVNAVQAGISGHNTSTITIAFSVAPTSGNTYIYDIFCDEYTN